VNIWLHDPTAAYVVLAVAFSGLRRSSSIFLTRAIYDRATALAAATLLAVSPLFWFYGSVGLTYAGEALVRIGVAYFAFRALRRQRDRCVAGRGYPRPRGGLRQSRCSCCFPLWLVAAASVSVAPHRRGRPRRHRGRRARVVRADDLVTGGLARYLEASLDLAETVVKPTSILGRAATTTLRMARYMLEVDRGGARPARARRRSCPWYARRHGFGRREWFS
jgi:hypothetical protein